MKMQELARMVAEAIQCGGWYPDGTPRPTYRARTLNGWIAECGRATGTCAITWDYVGDNTVAQMALHNAITAACGSYPCDWEAVPGRTQEEVVSMLLRVAGPQ